MIEGGCRETKRETGGWDVCSLDHAGSPPCRPSEPAGSIEWYPKPNGKYPPEQEPPRHTGGDRPSMPDQ